MLPKATATPGSNVLHSWLKMMHCASPLSAASAIVIVCPPRVVTYVFVLTPSHYLRLSRAVVVSNSIPTYLSVADAAAVAVAVANVASVCSARKAERHLGTTPSCTRTCQRQDGAL